MLTQPWRLGSGRSGASPTPCCEALTRQRTHRNGHGTCAGIGAWSACWLWVSLAGMRPPRCVRRAGRTMEIWEDWHEDRAISASAWFEPGQQLPGRRRRRGHDHRRRPAGLLGRPSGRARDDGPLARRCPGGRPYPTATPITSASPSGCAANEVSRCTSTSSTRGVPAVRLRSRRGVGVR